MSKSKLLDQIKKVIRLKHFSIRTEETYVHWIKRFIILSLFSKNNPLVKRVQTIAKTINNPKSER